MARLLQANYLPSGKIPVFKKDNVYDFQLVEPILSVFFLGCVGFSCVLQKYSEKQPVKHIILSSRRPGLKEKKNCVVGVRRRLESW